VIKCTAKTVNKCTRDVGVSAKKKKTPGSDVIGGHSCGTKVPGVFFGRSLARSLNAKPLFFHFVFVRNAKIAKGCNFVNRDYIIISNVWLN
jgi:hypothetical protein